MRKTQKACILEMLVTLHEAHEEIKKVVSRKQYASAQNILSDCQQSAISIGTAIEESEGQDISSISHIEEYCELLFFVYDQLENNSDVNANSIYKVLKKQLLKMESSIKSDIPVRKEIVFFPYKASMWDSLESIYLTAKAKDDCDAYCVPIPYYDKNPDGSLGQMHYEGWEYPDNIEVIDWQTYNFEERNPDSIYIHNPYDDWNYVTCVHPRFFSKNLKEHTEKLIYIPYFILGNIKKGDKEAVKKMSHFCFLPGIVNADKVILQSDEMKEIYINEYIKAAKSYGLSGCHLDRKKLKEKFLGSGSPKIDKLENLQKENFKIPCEWLKIIQKQDKSWKKIVFYNTSITALLSDNERMLKKIEYVLSVFKGQRDKIALLWRPHPLIQATISSMRPELWRKYREIVCRYLDEGWGIYDDTSDVDRAIGISDAYYGDRSSILQMYYLSKKPTMVQSVDIIKSQWDMILRGSRMAVDGNFIWLVMDTMNLIAQINKENGEIVKCVGLGSGYSGDIRMSYSYSDIEVSDGRFYLAPTEAEFIVVYDKDRDCVQRIPVAIPAKYPKVSGAFAHALQYNEEIIFVKMCGTNAIGRFNILTQEIKYIGKAQYRESKAMFGLNSVIKNNCLYIPLLRNGDLFVYDLEKNTEKIVHVDLKNRGLFTLNEYNGFLYISTADGQVLKISCDFKEKEEIKLSNSGCYYSSFCDEGILWLFPRDVNECAIKIELRNVSVAQFKIPKVIYDVKKEGRTLLLNAEGCIMELDSANGVHAIPYHFRNGQQLKMFWEKYDERDDGLKPIIMEGMPACHALNMYLEQIKGR